MTFGEYERHPTLGGLGQQDAHALVTRAYEAGVNLFDTADVYSDGNSERILGESLRNLAVPRESYLISTKGFGPMGKGPNSSGNSRGHLLDAAKNSLKRLNVDYIDLYQVHGFDSDTPMEETLRALDDLVRQGYVRYIGVSNWAAWQIAKALGISARLGLAKFDALQAYYSVAGRDLEREITPLLESEGVGLLVWSPLAGGFLSGKKARGGKAPEGSRSSASSFPPVEEDRGYNLLDAMRPLAEARGISVAQIAIAWLLHQKAVSTVLIGAKRMDQLEDNLSAANVSLTEEELAALAETSKLPSEYPAWMFEFWNTIRRNH